MWDNLKASIASVVRTNNNQEITGANLQSVLNTIVNTVGANATFAGIAVPSTNPGTPDGPVFYIACEPGVYSNFNLTLVDGLYILENKTGSWVGTQINTGAAFEALIGYYNAVLNGASITVPDATTYRLTVGGDFKLKMLAPGTTATTLTIGNATDIPIWYNGAAVSAQNTWEANEIISVFYDGTRFMASNSQGGGGKAEKIKYDNSRSGLGSQNVQGALDEAVEELTIEQTIDLSSLQSLKYALYGNAWHKVTTNVYIKAFSVVPNQKYRVVADNMSASFFYLAKQDVPADKKAVTYQHITTPANQTAIITIPNGIYYLVIQDDHGQTGGNTKFPLSMELLKGIDDVVDKHTNEITDIQSSVMGVIEQYTKEDCTVVGLLQIDGTVYAGLSNYRTSNYIPIPEGTLYIQYDGVYYQNAYTFVGLVVCDSSYNAIWSNTEQGDVERHGKIYIPDIPNAAYIRFSYDIGGNPTVKFLSAAANDFSAIAGSDTLRSYGSSVYNGTYNRYTNTFLCSIDSPCLEDGIITKIRGKWISAGNAKFYIGFIDQNGYVIVRDSFTVAVGSGDNTVDVSSRNISLYKDEYLFFSGQDSIKPYFVIDTSVTPKGSGASVDNRYGVRQDGVCWNFGWTVKTHKESFNELVEEMGEVKKQVQTNSANIAELQNNKKYYIEDSATGMNYQITVRNGNIVLVPMQFSNALVLGDSITSHGIASGVWYGVWGMAATKPEYDFVHVLEEGLQAKDNNAVCDCVNIAAWEKNFSTSLATLIGNKLTSETDFVVIRLGENVPNANVSGFATALGNLVDYIYSISPNAKVVITGVFWVNSSKENQIVAAASAKGIDYIRLDYLDNSAYKESLGHYVYGDDNQIHEITNSGVANHPNNIGMLRIANAILAAIGYGTVEKTYTLQEVTVSGVTGTMWVLNG